MGHDTSLLAVGSRLQIGRDRATVRYVGPIDGQAGDWVGLEWDDPTRGKHDGGTGGKQYFLCVHGGTGRDLDSPSCVTLHVCRYLFHTSAVHPQARMCVTA